MKGMRNVSPTMTVAMTAMTIRVAAKVRPGKGVSSSAINRQNKRTLSMRSSTDAFGPPGALSHALSLWWDMAVNRDDCGCADA